jgi:hypothetical protein
MSEYSTWIHETDAEKKDRYDRIARENADAAARNARAIKMEGVGGSFDELELVPNQRGRWVVRAMNQSGFDCTEVDLVDLIEWVRKNKPEFL